MRKKGLSLGATVSGGSAQACAGLDEGGDCLLPSWQKMSGARPGDGAGRAGRSDTPRARSSRPPLASRQSAGRCGHLPWEGEAPCEAQRWPSGWWRRPPAAGTAPCRPGAWATWQRLHVGEGDPARLGLLPAAAPRPRTDAPLCPDQRAGAGSPPRILRASPGMTEVRRCRFCFPGIFRFGL